MDILNNREIAALIIGLFLLLLVILKVGFNELLEPVFTSLKNRKIITIFLLFLLYIGLVIFGLEKFEIWDTRHFKVTMIWLFTVGVMSTLKNVRDDKKPFWGWVSNNFKIAILIEFVIASYVFGLLLEILLSLIITSIFILGAVAKNRKGSEFIHYFCNAILIIIALSMAYVSWIEIWKKPQAFFSIAILQELGMPILLSFLIIPFQYGVWLYVVYEEVFTSFNCRINDKRLLKYMQCEAIKGFKIDVKSLRSWARHILSNIPQTKSEISAGIEKYRKFKNIQEIFTVIRPKDGWALKNAQNFLIDDNLVIKKYIYNNSDRDLFGGSAYFNIGRIQQKRSFIHYRIEGDSVAVRKLELTLHVNHLEECDFLEDKFSNIAFDLFNKAVDQKEEVDAFLNMLKENKENMIFKDYLQVTVDSDENIIEKNGYQKKVIFKIIS